MSARAPEPSFEAAARGWRERAERAEEARDVAQAGRNVFVERARRAEAAISSVRARHVKVNRDGPTPTACKACVAGYDPLTGDLVLCAWPCPTIAALDSSETPPAAPDVEAEGPLPHLRGEYRRRAAPVPEERSDEKKFVECQLPVGWEWCALRIGHAGQCDSRPSAEEGRAANALTRPPVGSDEAPKKPVAARSPWHDCPVCGNWPCDEHREES